MFSCAGGGGVADSVLVSADSVLAPAVATAIWPISLCVRSGDALFTALAVSVVASSGIQYILQSTLTVDEILSDGNRINENDPGTVNMVDLENEYNNGSTTQGWENIDSPIDDPIVVPETGPHLSSFQFAPGPG